MGQNLSVLQLVGEAAFDTAKFSSQLEDLLTKGVDINEANVDGQVRKISFINNPDNFTHCCHERFVKYTK